MRFGKRSKIILCVLSATVLLLGGLSVLGTRSFFITGVILPRVGSATGLDIEAARIDVTPWSRIDVTDLRISESGEPLLALESLRCRYSLMSILRGTITVDELRLDGVDVTLVQGKDGRLNLPAAKAPGRQPAASPPKESGRAPRLDIRNVKVTNARASYRTQDTDAPTAFVIDQIELSLPRLANGEGVTLTVSARLASAKAPNVNLGRARFGLDVSADLADDLLPSVAVMNAEVTDIQGQVQSIDLAGRRVAVESELSRKGNLFTLEQFVLRQLRNDNEELNIRVSGTADTATGNADMQIAMTTLKADLLNVLAGLAAEMDFGDTAGGYEGTVQVRGGTLVTASGSFKLQNTTVASETMGIPALDPVDLALSHDVSIDTAEATSTVRSFLFTVTQNGGVLASATISDPVRLSWAPDATAPASDAAIDLMIQGFPLELVNPFLLGTGTILRTGVLEGDITCRIGELGQRIGASGKLGISGAVLDLPSYAPTEPVDATIQLDATRVGNALDVAGVSLDLQAAGEPVANLALAGSVPFDIAAASVTVAISSRHLNLDRLQGLLVATAPPAAEDDTTGTSTEPAEEPPPVDLGGLDLVATLDLNEVTYEAIVLAGVTGRITVKNNVVTIESLDLAMNDAPLRMSARLDLGVAGYDYSLSLNGENVSLEPVLATFAPVAKDRLTCSFKTLELQGSGRGVTMDSLRRSLNLSFDTDLQTLSLVKSPVLERWASIARIEEISRLNLNSGHLSFAVADGNVNLDPMILQGRSLRIDPKGRVGLDKSLDLSIDLGVGAGSSLMDSLRRMRILPEQKEGEGYFAWPQPIVLTGAVDNVEFSFAKFWASSLAKLGRDAALGALGTAGDVGKGTLGAAHGVGRDTIDAARGLVEGVGDAATGKKSIGEAAGDAGKGILGIGLGLLGDREKRKAEEEQKKTEEKTEDTDAAPRNDEAAEPAEVPNAP